MVRDIYIPTQNGKKEQNIPAHHPSLIMMDNQTDTTHHLSCGCCGGACIADNAWWDKKNANKNSSKPSSPVLAPKKSSVTLAAAATSPAQNPKSGPSLHKVGSSSSISSFSTLDGY